MCCFFAIVIVKEFKKNVIANSFFIVVTTFLSFLNFFHFSLLILFLRRCRRRAIFYHFVVKFNFDSDSFDFENIQQLLIFNFKKIKLILYYFQFFFRLNQKIIKTFYLRVRNIYSIINYIINNNNYITNLMLLFIFFCTRATRRSNLSTIINRILLSSSIKF